MSSEFNSMDLLQPRPASTVLLASTHSSWHTCLKPQSPTPNPIWKPRGFLGQRNRLHHSSSHLRGYGDLHWLVENLPAATGRNRTSVVHLRSVVAERGAWRRNKYKWHTGLEGTDEFVLCWLLRWVLLLYNYGLQLIGFEPSPSEQCASVMSDITSVTKPADRGLMTGLSLFNSDDDIPLQQQQHYPSSTVTLGHCTHKRQTSSVQSAPCVALLWITSRPPTNIMHTTILLWLHLVIGDQMLQVKV